MSEFIKGTGINMIKIFALILALIIAVSVPMSVVAAEAQLFGDIDHEW